MFSELNFSLRIWSLLAEVFQGLIYMVICTQGLRMAVGYIWNPEPSVLGVIRETRSEQPDLC